MATGGTGGRLVRLEHNGKVGVQIKLRSKRDIRVTVRAYEPLEGAGFLLYKL